MADQDTHNASIPRAPAGAEAPRGLTELPADHPIHRLNASVVTAIPEGAVMVQDGRWIRQESEYGPILIEKSDHPDLAYTISFDNNGDGRLSRGEIATSQGIVRENYPYAERIGMPVGAAPMSDAEVARYVAAASSADADSRAAIDAIFAQGYATPQIMTRAADVVLQTPTPEMMPRMPEIPEIAPIVPAPAGAGASVPVQAAVEDPRAQADQLRSIPAGAPRVDVTFENPITNTVTGALVYKFENGATLTVGGDGFSLPPVEPLTPTPPPIGVYPVVEGQRGERTVTGLVDYQAVRVTQELDGRTKLELDTDGDRRFSHGELVRDTRNPDQMRETHQADDVQGIDRARQDQRNNLRLEAAATTTLDLGILSENDLRTLTTIAVTSGFTQVTDGTPVAPLSNGDMASPSPGNLAPKF